MWIYSQTQVATDYNAHRLIRDWGEGGYRHTDQNSGSLRDYFIVQILPYIDWTYSAGEECRAMAEIAWTLQVNLVFSDAAATS